MKKLYTFFLISFFISFNGILLANEKKTRFILIGHMYPIVKDKIILNKLFNKINKYNADYVFILGDSNLHQKDTISQIKKGINSNLFFVPGNQELSNDKFKNDYLKNIGYLNKFLQTDNLNFILLNSSENKDQIIEFLNNNLNKQNGKINIILTHHRIWDDSIVDSKEYSHDKSYYFQEIYPYIKNKVLAIFAGNSKRQYFRDLSDNNFYGKQNVNLIYWMDKIGDIDLYNIGMGDGKPKASFVIVDVMKTNKFLVSGDFVTNQDYEILPKKLIIKNEEKLNITNVNKIRAEIKDKYIVLNKLKLIIVISIIIFFFIIYRVSKKFINHSKKGN